MAIDEHSLHFVGGRGDGSGAPAAGGTGGGCTKTEWENAAGINQTLSNIMGSTGEPLCDGTTADATQGAVWPAVGNYVRLTQTAGDSFTGNSALVGTIVYVNFAATYVDGYYIIVGVGDGGGDDIDIKLTYTGDQAGNTCYVGGAHSDLQDAIDEIADATDTTGNRWIYSNVDEDLSGGGIGQIVPNITGTTTDDAHVWIRAYNTQPGDMEPGETYAGTYVELNGQGTLADDLIAISDVDPDNLHFWDFYIHGTDEASGHDCAVIDANSVGLEFRRCKFGEAYSGVSGTVSHAAFADCIFEDSLVHNQISGTITYTHIDRCLFDIAATKWGVVNIGGGVHIEGCIFNGGGTGVQCAVSEYLNSITNCTFYNQTESCILLYKGLLVAANNIFFPAAVDDYAIKKGAAVGQVLVISNNCAYSAAGALTNPYYDTELTRALQYDESNIFVDPQFVAPGSDDFTPENWQLMESGLADAGGNPSHIGAVGKPSAYDIIYAEEQ